MTETNLFLSSFSGNEDFHGERGFLADGGHNSRELLKHIHDEPIRINI